MNMLMKKIELRNKNDIRKEMLRVRNSISNKEKISTIIVNKIFELELFKKSKIIALYKNMENEVNTSLLLQNSFNKVLLLPRVDNDNISLIKVDSNTMYCESKFHVQEPIGEVYNGNFDLIIVPGVAFDENFNRLGYGKGYYDRFLCNKNIYKIGICFDKQLIKELPVDIYDIKMDMIITEKRIIKKV